MNTQAHTQGVDTFIFINISRNEFQFSLKKNRYVYDKNKSHEIFRRLFGLFVKAVFDVILNIVSESEIF